MQLEDYFEFEKFDDGECIRLKGTRVSIEFVIEEFNRGATPDQIHYSYPTVTLEQVFATITYYLHNRAEVDNYICRSNAAAEAAYQEHRRHHQPTALQERLQALRAASQAVK